MNKIMLNHLSAYKQPTEVDLLDFGNRLKSEHYIGDIDDCLDWIYACLTGDSSDLLIEDDYNIDLSLDSNPVLSMNIIDESICSIVYHLFQMHKSKNADMISVYRESLEYFAKKIYKLRQSSEKYRLVITQLYKVILDLIYLSTPIVDEYNEESNVGNIANNYYCLMYFICGSVKQNQYFRDLAKFYKRRVH